MEYRTGRRSLIATPRTRYTALWTWRLVSLRFYKIRNQFWGISREGRLTITDDYGQKYSLL
jgi:hypothetical protein